jgi:hypothetical protein
MFGNGAGLCSNRACFVADAKEVVRPRRGGNFTCWHCGHGLSPLAKPWRGLAVGGGSAAAAVALMDVVKLFGTDVAGRS